MFQIKPYADKPNAFGLFVHSFVSYERIGKWDEERYKKGGRKPYFIELCGTPRWINLYAAVDEDVYYNFFIRNHTIDEFNCVCFTEIDFLDEIGYTIVKYTIDEKFVCGLVEVKQCSTTR